MSPALARDTLLEAARKTDGYADFGSTTFLEPLDRLLESIEATGNLHPFGRF